MKGSSKFVDVHRGSGRWRCSSSTPLYCNVAVFPHIMGCTVSPGKHRQWELSNVAVGGVAGLLLILELEPTSLRRASSPPAPCLPGWTCPWVLSSFFLSLLLPCPWPPLPPTSLFLEGRVGMRVSHASRGVDLSLLKFLTFVPQILLHVFWNYCITILFTWITEIFGVTLKFLSHPDLTLLPALSWESWQSLTFTESGQWVKGASNCLCWSVLSGVFQFKNTTLQIWYKYICMQ